MRDDFTMIFERVRYEKKLAFASCFVVGLLAHMYKFTNHIPNWDSLMDFYYPTHNMIFQGRQFQFLPAAFRAFKDLPWIIGLLSLIYLSLIAVMLVEMFDIRGKRSIILSSALLVVSPPVTSTLGYMFTADCYFFAALMAVLAVYVTRKYRYGWSVGGILLAVGVGIYQAYLSLAMVVIILLMIRDILLERECRLEREFWQLLLKNLIMGSLALFLYNISLKFLCWLEQVSLVNHHGLGSIHFPSLQEFFQALIQSYTDTIFYYVGSISKPGLYSIASGLAMLCLILFGGILFCSKHVYKKILNTALLLICVLLFPCVCHIFYFVTGEVEYYALMQFALVSPFYFLFWEYEQMEFKSKLGRWVTVISSGILVYVLVISANVVYRVQTLSYEKTYALMERVVVQMENLPEYTEAKRIAVIGSFPDTDRYVYGTSPALAGYSDSYMVSHQKHVISMLNEYYGIELEGVSDSTIAQLMNNAEIANMPTWPRAGSVTQVDDLIVLKVSEDIMYHDQE